MLYLHNLFWPFPCVLFYFIFYDFFLVFLQLGKVLTEISRTWRLAIITSWTQPFIRMQCIIPSLTHFLAGGAHLV